MVVPFSWNCLSITLTLFKVYVGYDFFIILYGYTDMPIYNNNITLFSWFCFVKFSLQTKYEYLFCPIGFGTEGLQA